MFLNTMAGVMLALLFILCFKAGHADGVREERQRVEWEKEEEKNTKDKAQT